MTELQRLVEAVRQGEIESHSKHRFVLAMLVLAMLELDARIKQLEGWMASARPCHDIEPIKEDAQ